MSMLAPYAIKQSRSISPRRRPIKKENIKQGQQDNQQERVQGQSHIIAEYFSVAKPPSRLRPSVGCLVNNARGPLARACIYQEPGEFTCQQNCLRIQHHQVFL